MISFDDIKAELVEKRDGKSAKDKDYSLKDWFKGGGWKQAGGKYDGKPCAKQPGQTTKPYCRDADDRAAMSKDERDKRASKKRREDPNADRKGKAKNVTQEETILEKDMLDKQGNDKFDRHKRMIRHKQDKHGRASVIDKIKTGKDYKEETVIEKAGEKDACYHKVKSRYSVWPSAYASGALVKCRKKGAANWGNKTKKEEFEFSNWRDEFKATEFEFIDLIKPKPLAEKCWKGYTKKGMKTMFGKRYPNCVKKKN